MDMSLIQASRLAWDKAQWRNTILNKGCQRAKIVLVAWALKVTKSRFAVSECF